MVVDTAQVLSVEAYPQPPLQVQHDCSLGKLHCGELILRIMRFLPVPCLAEALACASAWRRHEDHAFREIARSLSLSSCGVPSRKWREVVREFLQLCWETLRVPYTGPAAVAAAAGGPWWGHWVPLDQQPAGTAFPTLRVTSGGRTVITGDADEDVYVAGSAYPLRSESSWDLILQRPDDDVVDAVGVAFFGDGDTAEPVLKTAIVWNSDGEMYHRAPLQVVIGAEKDCVEVDCHTTWSSDARLRISLCCGEGTVVQARLARVDRILDSGSGFSDRVEPLGCQALTREPGMRFRPLVRMYGSSSATFVSGTLRGC